MAVTLNDHTYREIESLFERLRELAEAASLYLVLGIPDIRPKWSWRGQQGSEHEFLEIARQAGVRLVYYDIERFNLDSIIEEQLLGSELLTDDDDEADQLIVSAAQRALAKWSSRNGEYASITLRFLVDGVAHDLHVATAWFDQFVEEIGKYIDKSEEQWEQGLSLERDARAAEKRRQAEALARRERYARAKNDSQRRYIAEDMFPDESRSVLDGVLELAALIYWDIVEPEREKALAKRATEMRASGLNVSQIAALLGVTKERANRLIAYDNVIV